MQDLSNSAFKLWVYLAKNQNHYEFDLSAADAEQWGIPKTSYYRARNELE